MNGLRLRQVEVMLRYKRDKLERWQRGGPSAFSLEEKEDLHMEIELLEIELEFLRQGQTPT